MFTKTLICLFPARHQTLYFYQISYVGVLWLVEFNQKSSENHNLTPFPFDGIVTIMSIEVQMTANQGENENVPYIHT